MSFRYRKKPICIEAVQHGAQAEVSTAKVPEWFTDAVVDGTVYKINGEIYIKTLEGNHHVSKGDFIIRGVQGELYPCKPDIFAATYDPV